MEFVRESEWGQRAGLMIILGVLLVMGVIPFWTDNWVGGVSLCVRFSRLFELVENKWCSVEDMVRLGWGKGGEGWKWRSRLLAWEEESARDCCYLLLNIVLHADVVDK